MTVRGAVMSEDIEELAPAARKRVDVVFAGRENAGDHDLVTVEEPMEIRLAHLDLKVNRYVERSISITMRTPGDDFDLALGFLFSEGIIRRPSDCMMVSSCGAPSPDKGIYNTVLVHLADDVTFDGDRLLRHVFTSSSCGVCGKATLEALEVELPKQRKPPWTLPLNVVQRLPEQLAEAQAEFGLTGGLHAAATFDASGAILEVREDVGRHNALDKLIGFYVGIATEDELPLPNLGILLSGRMSFELIQKAAMAGIAMVVAIGPPSSLAIELAEERGIALAGFVKPDRCNLYTFPDRFR